MSAERPQKKYRLGFLTTLEIAERGYVGGLLVTNQFGRPLEFQCTNPVKPNRTQEILYGPTLEAYLLSELIGRTLIDKVSVKPNLVLIDNQQMLNVRSFVQMPVACVAEQKTSAATEEPASETAAPFKLGRQILSFHAAHANDRTAVEQQSGDIPSDVNLNEPFQRVREALNETLGAGVAR